MTSITIGFIGLLLVPALIVLGFAILARVQSHRFPASPGPRFAPTEEGAVARDALLLNQDRKAIAAVLVDLAVRRKVRLLRPAAEKGKRATIAVETVEGAAILPSEVAALEALFGRESTSTRVRRLSSDSRKLSRRVRTVLDAEEQRGAAAGFFGTRRCTWPTVLLRIFATIGIIVSLLLALGTDQPSGRDWGGLTVALVSSAIMLSVFFVTPRPWRRFTAQAEPFRAHLAGMREYIDLAEKEPLRMVQSVQGALASADVSAQARAEGLQRFHLHERMLPYAVLFGMEKSWLKTLGEHAGEIRAHVGSGDLLDATLEVVTLIEAVGSVFELVRAVGELTEGVGSAASFVGDVFDGL